MKNPKTNYIVSLIIPLLFIGLFQLFYNTFFAETLNQLYIIQSGGDIFSEFNSFNNNFKSKIDLLFYSFQLIMFCLIYITRYFKIKKHQSFLIEDLFIITLEGN